MHKKTTDPIPASLPLPHGSSHSSLFHKSWPKAGAPDLQGLYSFSEAIHQLIQQDPKESTPAPPNSPVDTSQSGPKLP